MENWGGDGYIHLGTGKPPYLPGNFLPDFRARVSMIQAFRQGEEFFSENMYSGEPMPVHSRYSSQ
jgi:hypothetical protein